MSQCGLGLRMNGPDQNDVMNLQDSSMSMGDASLGDNTVELLHPMLTKAAAGGAADSPRRPVTVFDGDADFEPGNGIEFESHEAAYSFYQEYAKSMGFTTSIKNSRRSKKSKEFIDAKFACSRYGITPESDGGSSRRSSVKKTDCKASMHVKRRQDGKWIIHEFVKEHNHELLPALAYHFRIHKNVKLAEKNNIDILHAVSERTRKMYVEMSRQCGGFQRIELPPAETDTRVEKSQHLVLEEGDAQKFQVEVLGVVGCHPKKESEDEIMVTFMVQDCEKDEGYFVTWNKTKSEVSCLCHLFEYRGFLCRHALIVLQISGLSSIPSHYILKRWTKDAKSGQAMAKGTRIQSRVQRYNDLCKLAIEMSEEGSLSEESYNIAFRTLVEALKNCVNVNNCNNSISESSGLSLVQHEPDDENQGAGSLAPKSSKKKNPVRKRKVQSGPASMLVEPEDSLQQMENLSSEGITLNGYYGTQQNVQGLDDSHLRSSHLHGNASRQG
ncbi:hypothetical protein Tsubulata_034822 [Turnera subulata]|uniref:Protein FAR1-RELATED SEQUENCE n=1 Tax=Turnera subulata TaxID=218843 RepID=A0A9Q0J3T3_9ROSI|nr:hypothetical protein Tsubulata_034822 [Turnera subulata]